MKKVIVKKLVTNLIVMTIIIVTGIQLMYFFNGQEFDLTLLLINFISIAVIGAISTSLKIRKLAKKNIEIYSNYELLLTSDSIVREIKGYPSVSIPIPEIKDIILHKNGNLTVRSRSSIHDVIGIPFQIERYDELEAKLSSIMPMNKKFKFINQEIYRVLFIIVLGGTMPIISFSENPIVLVFCVVLLLSFSIWSFIFVRKSKNLDAAGRRKSYLSYLVFLVFVFLAIYKIFQ